MGAPSRARIRWSDDGETLWTRFFFAGVAGIYGMSSVRLPQVYALPTVSSARRSKGIRRSCIMSSLPSLPGSRWGGRGRRAGRRCSFGQR